MGEMHRYAPGGDMLVTGR